MHAVTIVDATLMSQLLYKTEAMVNVVDRTHDVFHAFQFRFRQSKCDGLSDSKIEVILDTLTISEAMVR